MSTDSPHSASSLSATALRRRALVNRSLSILHAWGYEEIEVPLLAPYEDLRSTLDAERAAQLFRVADRSGQLLVLRGDLTPIVARQVALRMGSAPRPARLAYANRVARRERAFAREQMESYEVGLELVGAAGARADLEVVTVVFDLLDELALDDVEMRVGDVRIAGALLAALDVRSQRAALAEAIDRRDAATAVAVARDGRLSEDFAAAAQALCTLHPPPAVLDRLEAGFESAPALASAAEAVRALRERLAVLDGLGLAERVGLDLTARDDRGYYTGLRFHLVCERLGALIGGGGRYDRLYGHFGPAQPAVGCALRVDRLVALMEPVAPAPGERSVSVDGEDLADVFRRAVRARAAGDRVRIVHGLATGGEP